MSNSKKSIYLMLVPVILISSMVHAADKQNYMFPYSGKAFRIFVEDSYREAGMGDPEKFYKWFEGSFGKSGLKYPGIKNTNLHPFINQERIVLSKIKNPKNRTQEELRLSAYLHKVIKKIIPKFSLDRGFEFNATERLGERQCLLQSVLISGLLQEIGADAGTVMVYRNIEGQYSFNGHVTVLLKLANGNDIIVDASDPIPFVKHTGILARAPGYLYLSPVYKKDSPQISHFTSNFGQKIANSKVEPLKRNYVRSQFYYYRGERVPNGILAKKPTIPGLQKSVKYLQISINFCKENALSYYMRGLAYSKLGDLAKARSDYKQAYRLQQKYGWVPEGLSKAYRQS